MLDDFRELSFCGSCGPCFNLIKRIQKKFNTPLCCCHKIKINFIFLINIYGSLQKIRKTNRKNLQGNI